MASAQHEAHVQIGVPDTPCKNMQSEHVICGEVCMISDIITYLIYNVVSRYDGCRKFLFFLIGILWYKYNEMYSFSAEFYLILLFLLSTK